MRRIVPLFILLLPLAALWMRPSAAVDQRLVVYVRESGSHLLREAVLRSDIQPSAVFDADTGTLVLREGPVPGGQVLAVFEVSNLGLLLESRLIGLTPPAALGITKPLVLLADGKPHEVDSAARLLEGDVEIMSVEGQVVVLKYGGRLLELGPGEAFVEVYVLDEEGRRVVTSAADIEAALDAGLAITRLAIENLGMVEVVSR